MPQEFRVGHRSSLVSSLGWLLMASGMGGLLSVSSQPALAAMVSITWSIAALVIGVALLRRLEWGRRGAAWLLASLAVAVPLIGLAFALERQGPSPVLPMVASGVAVGLLVWTLKRLNSRPVRQEFA